MFIKEIILLWRTLFINWQKIQSVKLIEIFYYYTDNKKTIRTIDTIWSEYVCFNFLFENDVNHDRFFVILVLQRTLKCVMVWNLILCMLV